MRHLALGEGSGNDADHLSTCGQRAVRHSTHQPDAAAPKDETLASLSQHTAQPARGVDVGRSVPRT
jgi:hypothetical protein